MATAAIRCPRCGYRPFGPVGGGYAAGSPCPQCSIPLVAGEEAPAPAHGSFARPIGLEDRGAPTRAGRPGARRTSPFARTLTLVLGFAILFQIMGGGRLARRVLRVIEAVQRGEPVSLALPGGSGARGAGSDRFGPPGDFHLVVGTWDGEAVGAAGLWTFRFEPPAKVAVTEPDGGTWEGEGRVYWERGDAGGLRVLPGGYPFDVVPLGGDAASASLGTYQLRDPHTMQLCLGERGALKRTSAFGAQPGFTCWLLVRR